MREGLFMKESRSYANYIVVASLLLYAPMQFISTLMLELPSCLSTYFTFSFTLLYTLYFYNVRQVFSWVLAIIAPPIIFYLVIVIVSYYFGGYTASKSVMELNMFFMFALPSLAILVLILPCIEIHKRLSDKFIKISFFIYLITFVIHLFIMLFFRVLITYCVECATYGDIISNYLLYPIYLSLPLPLAIYAYINKREIEAIFHLGYMIFAPIIFFYILSSNSYEYDFNSIFTKTSIIFLIPPLFFVLKNWYLSYREYRNNPMRLDTSKTLQLQFNPTISMSEIIKISILLLTIYTVFFMALNAPWLVPVLLIILYVYRYLNKKYKKDKNK